MAERSILKAMFKKLSSLRSKKAKKDLETKVGRIGRIGRTKKKKKNDEYKEAKGYRSPARNFFRGLFTPKHPKKDLSRYHFGTFSPIRPITGLFYK